ncbi:MAG: protein translocase subunit SecF [Chloroflexota bacterium]
MIDFIGKRYRFFLVSGVLILIGIISLATFKLQPGVDFISGSSITLRFDEPIDQGEMRTALLNLGYDQAIIQKTPDGDYFIRIREISSQEKEGLTAGLEEKFGKVTIRDFYSVSPVIATKTGRDAGIAIIVAAVFILAYIAWAFRRMPRPFRWGTCAIVPLLHDVFIVLTVFSLLGWLLNIEVDALFITGVLAVVGYSINNTIVVFDRIRDNMTRSISKDFASLVNSSILETFTRSLNTSLTTLFVILALYFIGGATIRNFMMVLLVGVVVGTYSASCVAPQLLVVWERGEWGRFFSWLPFGKRKP